MSSWQKFMRQIVKLSIYVLFFVVWMPSLAKAQPHSLPQLIENLQIIYQRAGYQQLVLKGERLQIKSSSALSRLYTPLTDEFIEFVASIEKEIPTLLQQNKSRFISKSFLLGCYFSLRSLEALYMLHHKQPYETRQLNRILRKLYAAIQGVQSPSQEVWISQFEKKQDDWNLHYLEMGNVQPFFEPDMRVFRSLRFSPPAAKVAQISKKRILFVVVHGTQLPVLSQVGTRFSGEKQPVYQALKVMAQRIAMEENKEVDLLIVNWSGANSNEARIQAGTSLANLMEKRFPSTQYEDYCLGVSHGGNVLFWALELLKDAQRQVKKMILISTPHRADFPPPRLQSGGIFYNFYNPWDVTQYVGSFEMTARPSEDLSPVDPRRMYPSDMLLNELHNFQVRFDGRNPYHPEMKYLIFVLPSLIYQPLESTQLHFKLNLLHMSEVKIKNFFTPKAIASIEMELSPDNERNEDYEENPLLEDAWEQLGPF